MERSFSSIDDLVSAAKPSVREPDGVNVRWKTQPPTVPAPSMGDDAYYRNLGLQAVDHVARGEHPGGEQIPTEHVLGD